MRSKIDFIAVGADAGGSKCSVRCQKGSWSAQSEGASFNVSGADPLEFAEQFARQVEMLLPDPSDVNHIRCCIGVAGGGSPHFKQACEEFLASRWRVSLEHILVVTDARVALEAAHPQEAGVIVIAGTGSGCYGRAAPSSEILRTGGWGPRLGDPGSGTAIATLGVTSLLRELETGPLSAFGERVLAHLDIEEPSVASVLAVFYNAALRIAGLAPAILELFEGGNIVAREIVTSQCDLLATQCERLARRLGNEDPNICLTGGLTNNAGYTGVLIRALAKVLPSARVSHSPRLPVEGALDLAHGL